MLKVGGHGRRPVRHAQSGLPHQPLLPRLRRRMVDLEDAHAVGRGGHPPRQRVEARAEHHALPHASPRGLGQFGVGHHRARDHGRAHRTRHRVVITIGIVADTTLELGAEDRQGDGIGQHDRLVEQLVDGARDGHHQGGRAGPALSQRGRFGLGHDRLLLRKPGSIDPDVHVRVNPRTRGGCRHVMA